MAENWLEERIEKVRLSTRRLNPDSVVYAVPLSVAEAIRKHFSDLDPSKSAAEIAELKRKLSTCTDNYRAAEATAARYMLQWNELKRATEGEYWQWQGDGTDHLESLACPVVISPEYLMAMMKEIAELQAEVARLQSELKTQGETMSVPKQTIERMESQLFDRISTAQRNGMSSSDAISVGVKPLFEYILSLKSELAKPRAVLREVGDKLNAGDLVVMDDPKRTASFLYTDCIANYRCWDFGPVPPFPPVEEEKPPEWKRVRHKNNGTIHYAWETEGESSKPGFRYWRDSKDRVIPGEYVEVLQ